MGAWEVKLFGKFMVSRGGQELSRFRTRQTLLVFIYLALEVGKRVGRDSLWKRVWPDVDEDAGRANLRTALSDIRSRLGPDCLDADHQTVELNPHAIDTDLGRFFSTRDPKNCPDKLLVGFDDAWLDSYRLEVEDAYAAAVVEHMDLLEAEDARLLAVECLRRDPGRLDVRAKMREMGLVPDAGQKRGFATQFVGREREILEIQRLLESGRLVTITGLGGSGKTRLAAEVSRRRAEPSWFICLSDLSEANMVGEAIRVALKLSSATGRTALDLVAAALRDEASLIVLDNFEHVIAGAEVVDRLISECPDLRILVTSQVPLKVDGEFEYPLGRMAMESSEFEDVPDAIRLFVQRACASYPGFEATASNREGILELCRRLDGFPLALEIAAAKARVFSVAEMLTQLEDRFEFLSKGERREGAKHGSLRTALDWSFDRLNEDEQSLLMDLTVFRGGFTMDAVAWVCRPHPEPLIASLLSHAWIERVPESDPTRYRLLESVREYAAELLSPKRLPKLSASHAGYFLGVARACFEVAFQPEEEQAHLVAETEYHNLEAAWIYLRSHDAEGNLAIVTWLNWFYVLKGRSAIAEARVREAISLASDEPRDLLCFAHHVLGNFLVFQGRFSEAEPWFRSSLAMSTLGGFDLYQALSTEQLAYVLGEMGRFEESRQMVKQATLELELIGNPNWTGSAYCIAALVANREGKWHEARESGMVSVASFRVGGYRWGLASALNEAAVASRHLGLFEDALSFERESIEIKRSLNSPRSLALSLDSLAGTLLELDRKDEALLALKESVRIMSDMGDLDSLPSMYATGSRLAALFGSPGLADQALQASSRLRASIRSERTGKANLLVHSPGLKQPSRALLAEIAQAILDL